MLVANRPQQPQVPAPTGLREGEAKLSNCKQQETVSQGNVTFLDAIIVTFRLQHFTKYLNAVHTPITGSTYVQNNAPKWGSPRRRIDV